MKIGPTFDELYLALRDCVTFLIADTGKQDVNAILRKVICDKPIKRFRITKFSTGLALWKRLVEADKNKIWIISGIENAKDESVKDIIYYMLKRDEYIIANSQSKVIDFNEISLILITKAESDVVAMPEYCHSTSMQAAIIEI